MALARELDRFELRQNELARCEPTMFKKKSGDSVETEGEKENYEVVN